MILPLDISPLGVLAFTPLRVLLFVLPPIFVKMMKRKKVARNKSSNVDSLILPVLDRMVFASFSRSSEQRNSVVLVLVEDLREFS